MSQASVFRDRAAAAAAAGRSSEARALFEKAAALAGDDASILNSAASFFARAGDRSKGISLLRQAISANPDAHEAALNLAIMLTAEGCANDALILLVERERKLAQEARYWSVRANAERALGRKRDSLNSFERAAALAPSNLKAMHGRARMALETGKPAVDLYRPVLSAGPGDVQAWLGYAQALDAEGDVEGARAVAQQLVEQAPTWIEGLELLAQLRWAAGEFSDFTDHYPKSDDPAVIHSHCRMLAGVDRFADAADVAAQGRTFRDDPMLALLEAIHCGEAGDDERAEAIFAELDLSTIDRRVHEARHRLRMGSPERADELTESVIAEQPGHIAAWALRDMAWRLLDDPRHEWLHGQAGLVGPMQLDLSDEQMKQAVDFLDRLHDESTMPVGQSVRSGSQTRGGLFDRHDQEVRWIEDAFRRAVQKYRAELPPRDDSHPLLRHRDSSWRFAGSWSIRVFSGGRHTEHIHPLGLLSSAAYFAVPAPQSSGDPLAGWLELGRPPPDLRLNLPPLFSIEPLPGRCALFPSTLYHGTRPFAAGKRMTVAIDVHVDTAP